MVRARGPSLTALGVPGALANPVLNLYSGQTVIGTNDDWQDASNAATIQSSGFAPSDARESAIYITLNPGAYTAIVSGAGGTSWSKIWVTSSCRGARLRSTSRNFIRSRWPG